MKNNKGFSLVQVMVAAGLLGGVALGVMQLSKQMQSTTIMGATNLEENQIINHISTILLDADSCEKTFVGLAFGDPVESIKRVKSNGEAMEVYSLGETYGNRTISLKDMKLGGKDGEEYLELVLRRLKSGYAGPKEIRKKIALKLVIKDDKVVNCFSELSNVTETSVKKSCLSIGAIYDANTQRCKNIKLIEHESQVCAGENCKNIKDYIADVVVEISDKSTLCVVKYNPFLGFQNTKLDFKQNKCHANKADGSAVSCSINPEVTDCN